MTKKAFRYAALAVAAALALFFGARAVMRRIWPLRHADAISACALEYGVEPSLVMAVIYVESRFDEGAVSAAGASGLMQLTPDTFDWISYRLGLSADRGLIFDPGTNIRYGTFLLSYLCEEFQSVEVALCAYNAGRGTVHGWLSDPVISPDGKNLSHIPYAETRSYVSKVLSAQKIYEFLYYPGLGVP